MSPALLQVTEPQDVLEVGYVQEVLEPLQYPPQVVPVPLHECPAGGVPLTTVQTPAEQFWQLPLHARPLFCQVPVESHTCGWKPEHCLSVGMQEPVQVPREQA